MGCYLLDSKRLLQSEAHSNCDCLYGAWETEKEENKEGREKGRSGKEREK